MYAIFYNGKYEVFDSLLEAEEFRENLWNKGRISDEEYYNMEIVPYHWTMG